METILIFLSIAAVAMLAIILFQQLKPRDTIVDREIIDLKNQFGDFKTRQIEAQGENLLKQGELFNQTQKLLNDQLNAIMKSVSENLHQTQTHLTSQLGQTGTVIQDIQKKLGSLEETTRQVKEIGQDISSLQDILQAPKLRGNLGEYLLEDLLRQIFPKENFQMKYSFRSGVQVDAVIRLGGGMVPVDAKFPLESFRRLVEAKSDDEKKSAKKEFIVSVKRRIDEIAEKYIRPDEGTFDFALIYIPAENVFYETIIMDTFGGRDYEIFNYAIQRRVVPVSPNSFYAYLTAIAFGLKGFHIEQQAKEIQSQLSVIGEQFSRFLSDLVKTGKHIGAAQNTFEDCLRRGEKFNDQIGRIVGLSPAESGNALPAPEGEK